ncbi:MAG: prepilin-type N-terminal cleavage/methylation domain-containing protein [Flavobacteriales bacterium]|nr:prepilin-type N-terminal cleavage/methylation domain-containing protein [Flavobacteriales bacterium]
MKKKSIGFTLIEVMIVIAIIGILAAVAMPSFMDSIRKGRRADASDSLLFIQQLQEKYRANNTTFSALGTIGYSGTTSSDGYYTMTVTGTSATGYTITATAVSGKSQASDTGCTALTIVASSGDPRGTKGPASCWSS